MEDHYKTLEVGREATGAKIRAAYRRLALKWHPDKNPNSLEESNKQLKDISAAYTVLSDAARRSEYDSSSGGRQGQFRDQRLEARTTQWMTCFQSGYTFQFPSGTTFFNPNSQHASSMNQNTAGMEQYAAGMKQYTAGMKQYAAGMKQYAAEMKQYAAGMKQHGSPAGTNVNTTNYSNITMALVNGKVTETRTRTVNNVRTTETEVFENGELISSKKTKL